MKKILSLIIAVALSVSLGACGRSSKDNSQEPSSISQNGAGSGEAQGAAPSQTQDVNISETVLIDEANVKVTAKGLDANGLFGPEVKLLIENNSEKDLTFQCRNASVNGYMVETMMSTDVIQGKKANDSLVFMKTDLEASGIKTIADMEFSFHIFTTEGWEDYLDTQFIQLKTSAAETYEYAFDDSGNVAYDGDGIKIVTKGLSKDQSIFGPSIVIYIENNSGQDITVQARDASINGFMVDAIFSSNVLIGKHAVDTITFLSSELEENEITSIDEVELSFHIFDLAKWDTIVDTDMITITPL